MHSVGMHITPRLSVAQDVVICLIWRMNYSLENLLTVYPDCQLGQALVWVTTLYRFVSSIAWLVNGGEMYLKTNVSFNCLINFTHRFVPNSASALYCCPKLLLNPLRITPARGSMEDLVKSLWQEHGWEHSKENMLNKSPQATPFQVLSKTIFDFQVIVKIIMYQTTTSNRTLSRHEW